MRHIDLCKGTLYWLLVFILCVLAVEVSIRAYGILPVYTLQAKGIPYLLRFRLDPTTLFTFLPDSDHGINELGFRDAPFTTSPPAGKRRILVLGDSFPMGLFVSTEQTFPKRLAAYTPQSEVLNLGVQGYGPDQELLILRRFGHTLKPAALVWSLFPSNDYNDLIKNNLFQVTPAGEVTPTPHNAVVAALPTLRTSMMLRFLLQGRLLPAETEKSLQPLLFVDSEAPAPVTPATMGLMQSIVRAFQHEAARLQATLYGVVIPSVEQVRGGVGVDVTLHKATVSLLRDAGIPTADLYQTFAGRPELYTDAEHHLNEAGHHAAAVEIARLLARPRSP
jgi:lysophospholipase L1-like esterase